MGMGWEDGILVRSFSVYFVFCPFFLTVVKLHGGFLSRGMTGSNLGFTKE